MGGAAGHMRHPFDDKDFTCGDSKKIITLGTTHVETTKKIRRSGK